jgi:hypothetical protein
MMLFAAGLAVAATIGIDTGYSRLAFAFVLMGLGMGLAGAPATESIMSALPPSRANIGSAVNDTTRELGGALGVAVVGSIMSSLYAAGIPADAPAAAGESLGAAILAGDAVAAAAREAFVNAMSTASIIVAVVAALGALIAWLHLPGHQADRRAAAASTAPSPGR